MFSILNDANLQNQVTTEIVPVIIHNIYVYDTCIVPEGTGKYLVYIELLVPLFWYMVPPNWYLVLPNWYFLVLSYRYFMVLPGTSGYFPVLSPFDFIGWMALINFKHPKISNYKI